MSISSNSHPVSTAMASDTASGATAVSLSPAVAPPDQRMMRLMFKLTAREIAIASRIATTGESNRSIASHLGIRYETVRSHMKHIYDKTGVHCQRELSALLLHMSAKK